MPIKVSTKLHSMMSLAKTLPQEYEIIKNNDGHTNIIKNNRYVHSKYSVEKEAASILKSIDIESKKNIYAFYGFGLGYHLLHFAKNFDLYRSDKNKDDIYIIVFITDVPAFVYSYYNIDLTDIAEFNIIFLYYNEDAIVALANIAAEKVQGLHFITLPSIEVEYKNYSIQVKNNILETIEKKFSDLFTRLHFENTWIKNTLKNISIVDKFGSIDIFKNALDGLNAIIVAAGPTLNMHIEAIKKNRECYFIIATDTAYSTLAKNEIAADIIITVDAGIYNAFDFINENSEYPFLFMDIIAYPLIAKINESKTNIAIFSSNENSQLAEYIENNIPIKIQRLNISHTVATAAIDLAYFLGIKNSILIGFDNSYPNYERHAKHTLSFDYNLIRTDKLNTMESMYFDTIREQGDIENYPPTSYTLKNQIDYLSKIKYEGMNIIRIKANAIGIDEIDKQCTIEEYRIDDMQNIALEKLSSLYKKNDVSKEQIYKMYSNLKEIFYNLIQGLSKNYNLIIESGYSEDVSRDVLSNVLELLETSERQIKFLKNILSYTNIIIMRNTNYSTAEKALLLISEAIKHFNYFHTRIELILSKIK